jgi:hypothetical protein
MCRSIKVLGKSQASPDEIAAAALQFVRKVSGMRKPSKKNQIAFDIAVREITAATDQLLRKLTAPEPRPSKRQTSDVEVSA